MVSSSVALSVKAFYAFAGENMGALLNAHTTVMTAMPVLDHAGWDSPGLQLGSSGQSNLGAGSASRQTCATLAATGLPTYIRLGPCSLTLLRRAPSLQASSGRPSQNRASKANLNLSVLQTDGRI